MLKIIIPLISVLFLPMISSNFWIMSISTLSFLTMINLTHLTTQASTTSSMSQLFTIDSLSAPLIILTMWVTMLMLMTSYSEIINKNKEKTMFAYIIILCLTLIITFLTHNMIMFYIFFEGSLIPTMLLILGWGYQPERLQATMYLVMYTMTASLPMLISFLFLFSKPNNLSFISSQTLWSLLSPNLMTIWWLITIAAFMTKMPLYMFHLWLPKAHVEAPVAGSMILAGILLKLGSYGLLRLSKMFLKMNTLVSPILMSLSLCGAVVTSMICLRQTDLKSLIAYSSIGHMSLLMSGLMSNSMWGWNASLTMMIAHGLCSSSLFAMAFMYYESLQTRSLFLSKGMMTILPAMTMWWFLNCIMNMASPPTTNLLSEIFLIMGTMSFSSFSMLPLMIMIFLAAAYSLHLYTSSQHGPLSLFSSPMNITTQRNYNIILLHLFPAVILITKSDIIMMWT